MSLSFDSFKTAWANTQWDFSFSFGDLIALLGIVAMGFIALLTYRLQQQQKEIVLFPFRKEIYEAAYDVFSFALGDMAIPMDKCAIVSDRDRVTRYFNSAVADISARLSSKAMLLSHTVGVHSAKGEYIRRTIWGDGEESKIENIKLELERLMVKLENELRPFGIAIKKQK